MSNFTPSFEKRLTVLRQEIESAQDELKRLRKVYTKFPDVSVHYDRWHRSVYYSPQVNTIADNVVIHTSCDQLIAKPCIVHAGFHIHSDPVEFWIGDTDDNYMGAKFHSNWQEILLDKGINPTVIERLQSYKEKHRPDPFDDIPQDYVEKILEEGNE